MKDGTLDRRVVELNEEMRRKMEKYGAEFNLELFLREHFPERYVTKKITDVDEFLYRNDYRITCDEDD